jgi:hypothetical protein
MNRATDNRLELAPAAFEMGEFVRVFPIVDFQIAQLDLHEIDQGLECSLGYAHDVSPFVLARMDGILTFKSLRGGKVAKYIK